MDIVFRKSHSVFDTVRVEKKEPRRYGVNGELLIKTEDMDDGRMQQARQASVVSANGGMKGLGGGLNGHDDGFAEKGEL